MRSTPKGCSTAAAIIDLDNSTAKHSSLSARQPMHLGPHEKAAPEESLDKGSRQGIFADSTSFIFSRYD